MFWNVLSCPFYRRDIFNIGDLHKFSLFLVLKVWLFFHSVEGEQKIQVEHCHQAFESCHYRQQILSDYYISEPKYCCYSPVQLIHEGDLKVCHAHAQGGYVGAQHQTHPPQLGPYFVMCALIWYGHLLNMESKCMCRVDKNLVFHLHE